MLLSNFCDRKGRLWAYDKTRLEKLFPSTPKNVFAERDLTVRWNFDNTRGSRDHQEFLGKTEKSYEYEDHLGKIESRAAPVIAKIIKEARRNRCPRLSPEHRRAWKRFALALARRTPESQQRVSTDKSFEDIFYEATATEAKLKQFPLSDKGTLYRDPKVLDLMGMVATNVNAKFSAGVDPHMLDEEEKFSRETGLGVAVIRIPDKSFVIGSHGIAIVESSIKGDPARGGWFPIAHDVIVTHTPYPSMEYLLPLDAGNEFIIDRVNKASAENSWLIAGRSEDLVRSFMRGQSA